MYSTGSEKKSHLEKNVRAKRPRKIIEYNLNTFLNLIRNVIRQKYLHRIPRKKTLWNPSIFLYVMCNDTFTESESEFSDRDRDRFKKKPLLR